MQYRRIFAVGLLVVAQAALPASVMAEAGDLPPEDDTPEEVLRLEEPGYANSMVSGERLSLGDYARLETELQAAQETRPQISSKIKDLIFLLRLRKVLRTFLPFF